MRGYPYNYFRMETAGLRSPVLLGGLRYGLFPGDFCHSTRHSGKLDSAALHDGCVAGCGFPSCSIPSAQTDILEALGLTRVRRGSRVVFPAGLTRLLSLCQSAAASWTTPRRKNLHSMTLRFSISPLPLRDRSQRCSSGVWGRGSSRSKTLPVVILPEKTRRTSD